MPQHYSTLVEAVPGNQLTLTIDANIQHMLESAVAAAVTDHQVAGRAVGVVVDVQTGAILAMTTQPDYDPNQPRLLVDEALRAQVDSLTGEQRTEALQARRAGARRRSFARRARRWRTTTRRCWRPNRRACRLSC